MLNVVSLERAQKIILESELGFMPEAERVSLSESSGRRVYENIYSSENIPAFDRSTVDGFAVRASDTYGSSEGLPSQLTVRGEILMGESADISVGEGECVHISTGGMVPLGADSVVMVENTDCSFDDFCLIFKAVSPLENVTKKGDDLKEGQLLARKGSIITSKNTGVLAAVGLTEIEVIKKIKIGIISTGDELLKEGEKPSAGKIRDVNSFLLSALCTEMGCAPKFYGIIEDSYGKICEAVKKAVSENDIVLISGGSSAGVKDMTVKIISDLGKVHFHGIALKPGKPTIFGTVDKKAVFGLPGNPAAAFYVTMLTVKKLTEKLYGFENDNRTLKCTMSCNVSSNHGREEIISVKTENGKAIPVYAKSAFVSVLNQCDGYIIVDRNSEGLKENQEVTVHLF